MENEVPYVCEVDTGAEKKVDAFPKPFLQRFDPLINWKRKTLPLVMLKSTSPYLATMECSTPAMGARDELPTGKVHDVYRSGRLESFSLKGMMRTNQNVETPRVKQHWNSELDCRGSIFIMHDSIQFRDDSEELFLLRCTPEMNVIQDKDTSH